MVSETEKKLVYLNIGLGVVLVLSVVMLFKAYRFSQPAPQERPVAAPSAPAPAPAPAPAATPSVAIVPGSQARSLEEAYRTSSRHDAGSNIIEAWSRVNPEDKAKAIEELDKQVSEAKEALAQDPADKRAKHMLFIAETVKQLAANNFNYTAPVEPAETKEKR